MAFGDSIGLLFTLKAKDEASRVVTSAAGNIKGEVKELDSTVGRLAQSFGLSDSKAAALSKALPLVGVAAGVVGGAVLAAGTAVFNFAKNASDAGSAIFEAGQKTNVSAEFLSALKVVAEQSGSSFEGSTAKVVKWSNSLVDAARGNKELVADLKRFGIDAAEAYRNPEAALKTFIETFNRLPPSAANNEAAMKLFKDRSGELIPVLRAFGSDYEGLVRKLEASGRIWTQEAAEKADEFGDALTEVGQIASGMANTFGREVMPAITEAMKEIGDSATKNRDRFREAGQAVGDFVRGFRKVLDSEAGTILSWLGRIVALTNPLIQIAEATRALGASSRGTTEPGAGDPGRRFGGFANAPGAGGVAPGLPTAPADVTNEAAVKERQRKIEAANKAAARAAQESLEERLAMEKRFVDKVGELIEENRRKAEEAIKEGKEADRKAAEERIDAAEAVQRAIRDSIAVITEENTQLRETNELIRKAEILGAIDARTAALARQLAVLSEMARQAEQVAPVGADTVIPQGPGQAAGAWVDPKTVEAPPPPNFDGWKAAIGDLKEMAVGSFHEMAGALGSMVGQWVLYGNQAQVSARKMIATVMASVATQAAVQAVYETAIGIAALTPWGLAIYGSPVQHFKAAALLAGVAATAGLAGRAIAGNGFSGGGGGSGGSVAGASLAAPDAREDYRTRYTREQAEKDRYTQREDRRGGPLVVQLMVDGRELARTTLDKLRDGGDLQDGFRRALA